MRLVVMVRDLKVMEEAVPNLQTIARLNLSPELALDFSTVLDSVLQDARDAHAGAQRDFLATESLPDPRESHEGIGALAAASEFDDREAIDN